MNVVAGFLPAEFRRHDDQKHARQISQNGERERQRHEQKTFHAERKAMKP